MEIRVPKEDVSSASDALMLRATELRKVERLARRLEADRAALVEAMREAQASGASLREIADAAGLSHTGVAKQLRRSAS
jgi:hypothetical protein